ncbi:radical SAM protein [Brenneria goodwinii]|uniref:radical SAM protein n=1 Tax=Brenneria goodwinii TaxID=1109412 RepID=UPI000EF269D8|nr:radical SAM protein [Brenneria goodwinii]MCG8154639.1 radical SAM protein [Brenneria goodwinii]MCG8160025.1 radical SAM protein [Brenneria goodwinii]MCG8163877.1 radical SAM protein [Brenneria goodwinii]MCG8168486.1 radical SAM protein [Brenneria goodwinii]MCG8173959.1 radical SAM protein [Brenneria goodwinii]
MSIVKKKLRNVERAKNSLPLIKEKVFGNLMNFDSLNRVNVIELHLTDRCDLKCGYCSYKSGEVSTKRRNTFPFHAIQHVLALNPKAVVLAGGGEPTLYKDSDYDIDDVINELHARNISVGLITNGSRIIDTSSFNKLSWLRVSLDAIDRASFYNLKKGRFDKRLEFIHTALRSNIAHIGVGFLYNRTNIHQIYSFCEMIFSEFNDERVNIQFRPTCLIQSYHCPSANYSLTQVMTPDLEDWWKLEVEKLHEQIDALYSASSDLHDCILNNTNISDISLSHEKSRSLSFDKCYISLARWMIRADGNIYPCVMKATNNGMPLGNIVYERNNIGLKQFSYFNLDKEYCLGNSVCCRLAGISNQIIAESIIFNEKAPCELKNEDFFF